MRVALLSLLALTACTAEVAPPAEMTDDASIATPQASMAAVYRCADSTEIFALFAEDSTGTPTVALAIGDERLRMRQVEAPPAAKFMDAAGSTSLWLNAEDVTFDRGGKSVACVSAAAEAEAAASAAHGTTP